MSIFYGQEHQHPDYPIKNWQEAVSHGNTLLGYHDWILHNLEEASILGGISDWLNE